MAGPMSSEGRDLALAVLAEETIDMMQQILKSNPPAPSMDIGAAQGMAAKSEGIRLAHERLATMLTPSDMQAFDQYIEALRAKEERLDRILRAQKP